MLINAPTSKMGGGLTHLRSFIQELSRDSRSCEYLFIIDKRFPDEISAPWIKTCRVDFTGFKGLARFVWEELKLPRLFAKFEGDILISLLNFGPIFSNIPQIVFQRNPIYFSRKYFLTLPYRKRLFFLIRRYLTLRVMFNSLKVVTPSYSMKSMIREVYPQLDSKRFAVLPHGFDAHIFQKTAAQTDHSRLMRRDKERGVARLLYVSHLASHKGFEVAVQTMHELKKRNIQARLYLTTGRSVFPKLFDQLVLSMEKLNVTESISFLGPLPYKEIVSLYSETDVFFFPSWCESFGYPMMEAMASGLPIVAADTPVNKEICQRAAKYFAGDNPIEAAQHLQAIIKDPLIREALAGESQKVSASYPSNWKNYVDALIEFAHGVVKEKPKVLRGISA